MPVKIKQNININVNTTSKKDKTKTKKATRGTKTTRRKKTKKYQMVSYNPSNNAYNPNARTMQTSMPSSGGGGSIIINKSGYDMTPYSNLPTNNTNNLRIEDINQRFTDGFNNYHTNTLMPALNNYDRSIIQPQLQNVNNKFDEFEAGFKNYHDNFIQPSFYEAGRNTKYKN